MKQSTIQISDVIYNAANQSFEALVSVTTDSRTRKYPCAIDAPITMSFSQAAEGLKKQALRRDGGRAGLVSQMRNRVADVRAGRAKFSARAWLETLGIRAADKAA